MTVLFTIPLLTCQMIPTGHNLKLIDNIDSGDLINKTAWKCFGFAIPRNKWGLVVGEVNF